VVTMSGIVRREDFSHADIPSGGGVRHNEKGKGQNIFASPTFGARVKKKTES